MSDEMKKNWHLNNQITFFSTNNVIKLLILNRLSDEIDNFNRLSDQIENFK